MRARWKYLLATALVLAAVTTVQAGPVPGTWASTLEPRDLDGNLTTIDAYYDTLLDITWLANAQLAATDTFGLPTRVALGPHPADSSGMDGYIDTSGLMNWPGVLHWIDAMNAAYYLGFNGWRLPMVSPVDGSSFDTGKSSDASTDHGFSGATTDGSNGGWRDDAHAPVSELGHMYYVNLANLGQCDPGVPWCTQQPGFGLRNTGPFSNIQSGFYRSGTEYGASQAWDFSFLSGLQGVSYKSALEDAWPVHDGDIGVPVPAPQP